jgi:hypothetical protein
MIMYDTGLRSDTIVQESVTDLTIRFPDLGSFDTKCIILNVRTR